MEKHSLDGIIRDFHAYAGELPDRLRASVQRLEQLLSGLSERQVTTATDGVVTAPAGEQAYEADDLNLVVNELFQELTDYVAERRSLGTDERLESILARLRGETDAYERDFP